MRGLVVYWEALVRMFQDPVAPEPLDEVSDSNLEASSLSQVLRQMGVLDQNATLSDLLNDNPSL